MSGGNTRARKMVAGLARCRPGRIHLVCPGCGRKQSNAHRREGDPLRAFVCVLVCERCGAGGFVDGPDDYLFKNGEPLPFCNQCARWTHDSVCPNYRVRKAAPKRATP